MENRTFRIGQIVPSSNTTMETEIPAMLRAREQVEPERFTFHSSRMRMRKVTKDELAAMDATLGVDRVVDHAHGVGVVDALHGSDTRQILHGAEGDLRVRHSAGRGVGTPNNGGRREQPSGSGQNYAAG